MIIDEDGEVSDITEEDFKRAIKNPYAEKIRNIEKIHRVRTFFLDENLIKHFDELAEKKGTYRDEIITQVLKDYLIYAGVDDISYTANKQNQNI